MTIEALLEQIEILKMDNEKSFQRILELTSQVSDAHEVIHTLEADLERLQDQLNYERIRSIDGQWGPP